MTVASQLWFYPCYYTKLADNGVCISDWALKQAEGRENRAGKGANCEGKPAKQLNGCLLHVLGLTAPSGWHKVYML